MYRVFLVMVSVLCAEAGLMGEAFFCRDPDTGKLHAINTTWRSSSFCGNYHCRLRRKNLTEFQYAPLRQINVTNVNLGNQFDDKRLIFGNNKILIRNEDIDVERINDMVASSNMNVTHDDMSLASTSKLADGDRYLTEQEIEAIAAVLHTVKKSDLDAIIDIFNLAQAIYKELDLANNANITPGPHDMTRDIKINQPIRNEANKKRPVSYWYDPIPNNKQRNFIVNTPGNTGTTSTNLVPPTTSKPTPILQRHTTPKPLAILETPYFEVPTNKKDKLKPPHSQLYNPSKAFKHTPLDSVMFAATEKTVPKYQKDIKPSVYLPYPFSHIPHYYNYTNPQTIYYKKQYVERVVTKRKHYPEHSHSNTKSETSYPRNEETENKIPDQLPELNVHNAVLVNPDLENYDEFKPIDDEKDDNKDVIEKRVDDDYKRDWQIDPISKQLLENSRAHVEKPRFMKPFYLEKKIKFERPGRIINLEDLNIRKKRQANFEPKLFEVYIEKTVCQSDDTVPGFFRYGNISEPYPNCCPQRIL